MYLVNHSQYWRHLQISSEEGLYERVDAGGGHGLLEPVQAGVQPPLVPQHGRAQPGEPSVQARAAAVVVQQGNLGNIHSLCGVLEMFILCHLLRYRSVVGGVRSDPVIDPDTITKLGSTQML